jgi:hypothetical protein
VRCGEAEAGVRLIGTGRRWGGGEAAVEFYSSSVSKELEGEEQMGRRRFSGGSEGGMTTPRFGSSRVEEGGADRSRRWEPMYWARRPSGVGRFRWE